MTNHFLKENPAILTRGGRFIDPQGREVILHGVNLVCKDPKTGFLGSESAGDFATMRRWGFNCVRLGVQWAGLEPEPWTRNDAYLRGIDQRVKWARDAGLYVILDMHQDLYGVKFSDGAPEWATLTGGQSHFAPGGIWSDAYFTSPAVQAAFDNFWRNTPAPNGMGLQDHYARAWGWLAERYASEAAVIGYDLMNEPFPGSAAQGAMMQLLSKGGELLAGTGFFGEGEPPNLETIGMLWMDPAGRAKILEMLGNVDLYAQLIDSAVLLFNSFEQEQLMALYRRVAAAIRAVDQQHILFLETSLGSNMGMVSAIMPLENAYGERDPQQTYAPHGYDLVVDTENTAAASAARVGLIFSRHGETARRLELPMLVGEWGAFYRNEGTLPAAEMVARQLEKERSGDTYWEYSADLRALPPFKAISRPYPERVAGKLESSGYDTREGVFTCHWTEDGSASGPSRVYLPGWLGARQVTLNPAGNGWQAEEETEDGVWLLLPQVGGSRTLEAR